MKKDKPLTISRRLLKELNTTEEEVLKIIDKVAKRLSYKFTFGSYEREDIEQEARILALQGLESYKPDFPLENFLWVHVRNRLVNFKRNNYIRRDEPCLNCPLKAFIKPNKCKLYKDRDDCKMYLGWKERNEAKKNIISPVSISVLIDDNEGFHKQNDLGDKLDNKELINKIDNNISIEMRAIWLQAKAGVKVHAEDMRLLIDEIRRILDE